MSAFLANHAEQYKGKPNWHHVGMFLGLTFILTWTLDLLIYIHGGLGKPGALNIVQLQMLFPAFSAIVLGICLFPENPLYYRRLAGRGRWFYFFFLLFTVISIVGDLGAWLGPPQGAMTLIAAVVPQLLAVVGLLFLIVLRLVAGREAMSQVWLSWGNRRDWLLFAPAIVGFYVLQVVLNALSGLGPAHPSPIASPPGVNPALSLILIAVQSVFLAPILALVIAFGEEYGWRGYLQNELLKLGRVRGVLLVGVIWGVWHWPLILMGFSYPGYPLLGLLLTVLFTLGFAVVLGYAVLRSGSILLAAYLHALNDQTTAFLVALGYKPFNPAFSFGVGIFGIATLALVAFLILRSPLWQGKGNPLVTTHGEEAK